ncbi:hypothetical protein IJJ27_04720 [bacterium]|nr:hypothetical protein [bacterium]
MKCHQTRVTASTHHCTNNKLLGHYCRGGGVSLKALFFAFLLVFLGFGASSAGASVNLPLSTISIGDHVSLGGEQFIKLNNTGLLMMSSTLTCPHGKRIAGQWAKCFECPEGSTYDSTNVTCTCTDSSLIYDINTSSCTIAGMPSDADTLNCTSPVGFMDTWNSCSSLALHETVCLADPRDYRTYRVRKLADGKCWMVDSLKFGGNYGDTDGCAANNGEGNFTYAWCGGSGASGCTAGGSNSVTKAQETFATGFYGHCRQNTVDYNYLYDWVAALQNTLAYYGSSTTFDGTQQGLCPTNWHLPAGGSTGEFKALADLYGTATSTFFWTETSKWNGQFSGYAYSSGALDNQGTSGGYWSSTADSSTAYVYSLYFNTSAVYPALSNNKRYGLAVRCIRD